MPFPTSVISSLPRPFLTSLPPGHFTYPLLPYSIRQRHCQEPCIDPKILNFAARVISGRRKYDHVSDVRDALGSLDSSQLLHHQSLSLLHKIIQTGEPESIASQIRSNRDDPVHVRTTRQDHLLQLPTIRTEAGRRRFLYWVVQRYNALPAETRELRITRIRTRLRSHADLCQGSKKVRDPGFAESKVWDLDGSWTLHVLFAVGLWKPRTSKLCYAARPWKPRTLKFGYVAKPWKPRTQNLKILMSRDLKDLGPYTIQYRI